MADTNCQTLLDSANNMNEYDKAAYYHNIAQNWYHLQNKEEVFKAFSNNLKELIILIESTDKNTQLYAIKTVSFISSFSELHLKLLQIDILQSMANILQINEDRRICDAALSALNHLCNQSLLNQKEEYDLVTDFCKNKQSLMTILRYARAQDIAIEIIQNVMSILAALCTNRPYVQEDCIRADIIQCAYNLKMLEPSNDDGILYVISGYIRNYVELQIPNDIYPIICLYYPVNNVDLFLYSIGLHEYPMDTFKKMYSIMCVNMGHSSRALCLAIWRLIATKRLSDALRATRLYTAVQQISVEDATLDDDWYPVIKFKVQQ